MVFLADPSAPAPRIRIVASRRQNLAGEGQVTFSIDLSRLDPRTGFDAEALDEIARTLEELGPQGDDT